MAKKVTPEAPKSGLRKAQVRILQALAKAKGPLSKSRICDACAKEFPTAAKFQAWMADPLGSLNPTVVAAAEARCGYRSLLSLRLVQHVELDIDGKSEDAYQLTAAGRKALAKAE